MSGDAHLPTEMSGPEDDGRPEKSGPVAGRPWGKYLIEKRLGGGGQADVFQAFDQVGTAGHVALKVPRQAVPREHVRAWVETEAGAVGQLEHPNIVRVVDCGTVGDFPYVATELVTGLPLNEHVRTSPPSLRDIRDWMIQLAEAVDVAHRRGIVHRDIKPLNVIVTPERKPRLIDFGLASFVTAYQTEPRRDAAGTYPFMAPEQARGDPNADHRVDVFALGGLLKYLLVHEGPYHGVSSALKAAREGDVRLITHVTGSPLRRGLCRIANRALAADPARRYQTVKELAGALRRLRPGRARVVLALAAAVLVVAGAAWLLTRGPATEEHEGETDAPRGVRTARARVRSSLEIVVHARDQESAVPMEADALPVLEGDGLEARVRLPRPMHVYVAAVSSPGGTKLLYPPEGEASAPVDRISLPIATEGWLQSGTPACTITVLMTARDEPLPARSDALQRIFAALPAPTIAGLGMLVFDGEEVHQRPSMKWQAASGRRAMFDQGFLGWLAERKPREWQTVAAVAFPLYPRDSARLERLRQRLPEGRPGAPDANSQRRSPERIEDLRSRIANQSRSNVPQGATDGQ